MAVFLLNICKFNKCGMEFGTLVDLIQHIEENHIGEFLCRRRRTTFELLFESIWKLNQKYMLMWCLMYADYDPITKPDCLPLSCVQRFITDATRKENPQFLVSSGSVESIDCIASERVEVKRKIAIKHHSYSMSSSNRSNTPTGKR